MDETAMDETAMDMTAVSVESAYSGFLKNSKKTKRKMTYFDQRDVIPTDSCPM